MRRRASLVFIALALLIVGGASIYWYLAARRVSEATLAWAAARRAEGWTISISGRTLGGWPRTAAVVLSDFRIAGGEPDIPGGVVWQTDRLVVGLDLIHPDHLDMLAQGMQRIGPLQGAAVAYRTELTRLRIPLRAAAPAAGLDLQELRVGTDGLAVGAVHALIGADPTAGRGKAALTVLLDGQGIVLPADVNWPLGRHVAWISADAAIDGPIPPPRGFVTDVRAWRDGGGAVDLRRVDLRWGPLDGRLSGTASLDRNLQPLADGAVHASNYAETLDVLAARGIIGGGAALAAKAVLSLLASVPPAGPARIEVPFTIRDGVVAVRAIPLVKVPPLQWPSR